MPQAPVPTNSQYTNATKRPCGCDFPQSEECACSTSCAYCWPDFQDPLAPARGILFGVLIMLITIAAILGVLWVAFSPNAARGATPKPVAAPQSLLRARAACPNTATLLECRAALVRAYAGNAWQRKQTLELARQMVGRLTDWRCIHSGEGAWNSNTGNGYFGGLQFDSTFERTYGRDMLQRHHAHADHWTPREQIIVAQRAFVQGRGYAPWPQTSRACGLR